MTPLPSEKHVDLLMIGSSIFEFWGTPLWGDLIIANHAIRSTTTNDWLIFDKKQLPEAQHILIYCGSNDLVFGFSDKQIHENLQRLISQLSARFKTSKIGYLSIIKCPQKEAAQQIPNIERLNLWMQHQAGKNYRYFEFNEAINGQPHWFVEDGLHLTADAYQMLNTFFTPRINKWVQSANTAD